MQQCATRTSLAILSLLALACLASCSDNTPAPAQPQGIAVPEAWGPAINDFVSNREGASIAAVLDTELAWYRSLSSSLAVEEKLEDRVTFTINRTDMLAGMAKAAGKVAPAATSPSTSPPTSPDQPTTDATPSSNAPDARRYLLEVRKNGPVFVLRTREFDIADN
jgi:hypothetical protein